MMATTPVTDARDERAAVRDAPAPLLRRLGDWIARQPLGWRLAGAAGVSILLWAALLAALFAFLKS